MESVKNVGQIVLGYGLAYVLYRDVGLCALFIQSYGHRAPGGGELHRVVGEVIYDLRYRVAHREHLDRILRKLRVDVKIFILSSALKAQKALQQKLGQVKPAAL